MQKISELSEIYIRAGNGKYSEDVSQLQHAIQVAQLAEKNHASDSQIAACLLHDIGHLIFDECLAIKGENDKHEIHGANILSQFFGAEVYEPVRLHVEAKRYLCSVDSQYYSDLSKASKESLVLQGGLYNNEVQIRNFENNSFFQLAVQLRKFDDIGKNPEYQGVDFSYYFPLLKSLNQNYKK